MNQSKFSKIVLVTFALGVTQAANIISPNGEVFVIRKSPPETVRVAGKSFFLDHGQMVTTGANSSAKVLLPSGTVLRIRANTKLINVNDTKMALRAGMAFTTAAKSHQNSFVLVTPEVKVRVKGTSFASRIVAESHTAFAVTKGTVQLLSKDGQSLILPAGQKVQKPMGKAMEPPEPLSQQEMDALAQLESDEPAQQEEETGTESDASAQPAATSTGALPDSQDMPATSEPAGPGVESAKTAAAKAPPATSPKPQKPKAPDSSQTQEAAEKPTTEKAATEPASPAIPDQPEVSAKAEAEEAGKEEPKKEKEGGIGWEVGFGTITIDGKQWYRVNVSPDIPIWKFGVCLDLELFIDDSGSFNKKGWEFDNANQAIQSITRKIKYVRFGKSGEPVFLKLGALDGVTLGYGLIMSNFGNMFEYPVYKKLGLQFELNGFTPVNLGLQAVIQDLQGFKNSATVAGLRLSTQPLASMKLPLLSKLEIGAMVAGDENQYKGLRDTDDDGVPDKVDEFPLDVDEIVAVEPIQIDRTMTDSEIIQAADDAKQRATDKENDLRNSFRRIDKFVVAGFDAGMPIIQKGLVGLTVYGQYAMNVDYNEPDDPVDTKGWGVAAPGFLVQAGPISGNIEFRHVSNRFEPSYFNSTYEQDRLKVVGTTPEVKEQKLDSVNVNGIFASLQAQIGPVLTAGASYQHLLGEVDSLDNKELSAQASLGQMIVERIPKLASAAAYVGKTRIGRDPVYDTTGVVTGYDSFFAKSRYMMFGYKIGFELADGIVLLWDRRTVYVDDDQKQLVPDTRTYIQTQIKF